MSIDSSRIVCTGCTYETREVYRPIRVRYQTTDGKTVETGRALGWCYNCSGYREVEKMNQGKFHEELVSTERQQLEIRHRLDALNRSFLSRFWHRSERRALQYHILRLDTEMDDLAILLEISKKRKSKARCLTCWSDITAPLTFDPESNIAHDFQHECGGNLQIIDDHSGPRFNFRVTTYVLNEEGDLIGDG